MRSKRKQKRILKLQPPKVTKGLPDPFSANNPELVEREEEAQRDFQDACPCCIDRLREIEWSKKEREYLEWIEKS